MNIHLKRFAFGVLPIAAVGGLTWALAQNHAAYLIFAKSLVAASVLAATYIVGLVIEDWS